jgi:hypothetical protein
MASNSDAAVLQLVLRHIGAVFYSWHDDSRFLARFISGDRKLDFARNDSCSAVHAK